LDLRADLEAAAAEEMARACTLGWAQIKGLVPYGDDFEGFTPAGRAVNFDRGYLWEDQPGGDIRVEVVVYEAEAYEQGVRLTRWIRPGEDRT
jgi:hypothetical protein